MEGNNSNLLVDIIRENGDCNFNIGMKKYGYMNKKELVENGIPYNFYLLIQTTSSNGCEYRYAFIRLFQDVDYQYLQKLNLIDLINEVKLANHGKQINYGVAGQKAWFLNCNEKSRMSVVNNTKKFQCIMSWLEDIVLDSSGDMDKYGNLRRNFFDENFSCIEMRPIFPIMSLGKRSVTGERGSNYTDVNIVMGFPLEIK